MQGLVKELLSEDKLFGKTDQEAAAAERLAGIDEMRLLNLDNRIQQQAALSDSDQRWEEPKLGDAVLIRRLQQDKERGHKLEPQWEGLYLLFKLTNNGQAGWVTSMHGEVRPSKYHLNDMKRFAIRVDSASGGGASTHLASH
ncbi:hypothetical protein AC579_7464 [Pseudocercospora musae]|uniref:Uncharacterized protein n=1 Tax=Pseudocercospora musae TaxID=113226 RepID=A0A139H7P6_9PEZI|nr:hypothetical protein AC579_7464 [Pseudocercospora musae]